MFLKIIILFFNTFYILQLLAPNTLPKDHLKSGDAINAITFNIIFLVILSTVYCSIEINEHI